MKVSVDLTGVNQDGLETLANWMLENDLPPAERQTPDSMVAVFETAPQKTTIAEIRNWLETNNYKLVGIDA